MNIEFELWALPVTQRCHNIFKRNGIQSIADLTKMTKFDLLMLPNLGRKSVQEIVEVLAERGLALSTGPEDCYHWLEKGKQINRQLKGLASMKENVPITDPIEMVDPTWMAKTGGYARDMTLRDHYAGLAMQGMMVDVEQPRCNYIAQTAYEMADAMLDEREKK
jgi:hypothetical protein